MLNLILIMNDNEEALNEIKISKDDMMHNYERTICWFANRKIHI